MKISVGRFNVTTKHYKTRTISFKHRKAWLPRGYLKHQNIDDFGIFWDCGLSIHSFIINIIPYKYTNFNIEKTKFDMNNIANNINTR